MPYKIIQSLRRNNFEGMSRLKLRKQETRFDRVRERKIDLGNQ